LKSSSLSEIINSKGIPTLEDATNIAKVKKIPV